MIYLISIITFIASLFAAVNTRTKDKNSVKSILFLLASALLLISAMEFSEYGHLLTVAYGILLIYTGFSYLGMFKFFSNQYLNPFNIPILMLIVITLKGELTLSQMFIILILFISIFYIIFYIMNKIIFPSQKRRHYFTDLLELSFVVNGIFLFIMGFILAVNRIQFLEKMAAKFF